jgi:hypothetical protein
MSDIVYIGENEEERLNVQFKRMPHEVYNLQGNLVSNDDEDWVIISVPGDKYNVVQEIADDGIKRRFPRQWAAYSGSQEAKFNGTPIDGWEGLTDGQKKLFNQNGFNTIEQVALAQDNAFMSMHGGTSWKHKAQAYLSKNKSSESDRLRKLEQENAEMREKLNQLLTKKAG